MALSQKGQQFRHSYNHDLNNATSSNSSSWTPITQSTPPPNSANIQSREIQARHISGYVAFANRSQLLLGGSWSTKYASLVQHIWACPLIPPLAAELHWREGTDQ